MSTESVRESVREVIGDCEGSVKGECESKRRVSTEECSGRLLADYCGYVLRVSVKGVKGRV